MIYKSFARIFTTQLALDNYVEALMQENMTKEQMITRAKKIDRLRKLKQGGHSNKDIYKILGVNSYIEYFKI